MNESSGWSTLAVAGACIALGFAAGSLYPAPSGVSLYVSNVAPATSVSTTATQYGYAPRASMPSTQYSRPQMSAMPRATQVDEDGTPYTATPTQGQSNAVLASGAGILAAIATFAGLQRLQSQPSSEGAPILTGRRQVIASTLGAGLTGVAGAAHARGGYVVEDPKAEDAQENRLGLGLLAAFLGTATGIGGPMIYQYAEKRDRDRLEEIRAMNKEKFKETGETLTEDEIMELRPGRWTDRREYADDD